MTQNNTSSLMDKLVHDYGLNPVYNENGQLLIVTHEVGRVFDRSDILSEIDELTYGGEFEESNFPDFKEAAGKNYPSEGMWYYMTITGLIALVKDYTEPIAKQFMNEFLTVVAQQDLLLKNEEFILYRASQILQNRADKKTRRLVG